MARCGFILNKVEYLFIFIMVSWLIIKKYYQRYGLNEEIFIIFNTFNRIWLFFCDVLFHRITKYTLDEGLQRCVLCIAAAILNNLKHHLNIMVGCDHLILIQVYFSATVDVRTHLYQSYIACYQHTYIYI